MGRCGLDVGDVGNVGILGVNKNWEALWFYIRKLKIGGAGPAARDDTFVLSQARPFPDNDGNEV